MKLTTGIVALAITAGTAWAQNPTAVTNTKQALQAAQPRQATAAKPAAASPAKPAAASQPASKPTIAAVPTKSAPPVKKPAPAVKIAAAPAKAAPAKKAAVPVKAAVAAPKPEGAPADADAAKSEPQQTKYSMTGRRDPFISPVVSRAGGSGCSTGKKCLDIEQIALRGVVRSDAGMIAVVTNGLNKAYFLRENDPVFNGYVVKITGDSVVFKETFQDKLGKPFTKDVVKKITTPAV